MLYYPSSFVRSSSNETDATRDASPCPAIAYSPTVPPWQALSPLSTVSTPYWVTNGKDDFQRETLPHYLYPILSPPTFYYPRARPINMSRWSSATNTSSDTLITETQDYEATNEDIDGTPLDPTPLSDYNLASPKNRDSGFDTESEMGDQDSSSEFEVDSESEDDRPQLVRSNRVRFVEKKKAATIVTRAVSKHHSPKCAAKAAQSSRAANKTTVRGPVKTKAPATGGRSSDGPAKRTRSSARQQPTLQIVGNGEDQIPPTKFKARKTWLDWEKATLKTAIHNWWAAGGAAAYNHRTKIILPIHTDYDAWSWMLAECQRLETRFKRKRGGLMMIAPKLRDDGLL